MSITEEGLTSATIFDDNGSIERNVAAAFVTSTTSATSIMIAAGRNPPTRACKSCECVLDKESDAFPSAPASWVRVQDTDGEVFYYNQTSDESCWTKPSGVDFESVCFSEGSDVRIGDWVQILGTEASGTYWTNEITGELKWETPEVIEEMKECDVKGGTEKDIVLRENESTVGFDGLSLSSCEEQEECVVLDAGEPIVQRRCDGIVAAAIITATTSATSIMVACSTQREGQQIVAGDRGKGGNALEATPCQESQAGTETETESETGVGSEGGTERKTKTISCGEVDDVSVISQDSSSRSVSGRSSIVPSATAASATSVMLAAVNKNSSLLTNHEQEQEQSTAENSAAPAECSASSRTSCSVVPPMVKTVSLSRHSPRANGELTEELSLSSRQCEVTLNKFLAVDVISHESAWLFHLIDRNSDASLTLEEFTLALEEQPLVSMVGAHTSGSVSTVLRVSH